MRRISRKIRLILVIPSLVMALLMPAAVFALDQQSFGGNNSSDYQPPTGNPQNNTPANLQPNNKVLQPVTVLNQQSLIQSGGLSVLTAPDKGAASTAPDPVLPSKSHTALITWSIGGLLTLAAVVYILSRPDKEPQTAVVAETPAAEKLVKTAKQKTSKKPGKKTSRKKRKTARS